jgi:hypothetical protein
MLMPASPTGKMLVVRSVLAVIVVVWLNHYIGTLARFSTSFWHTLTETGIQSKMDSTR